MMGSIRPGPRGLCRGRPPWSKEPIAKQMPHKISRRSMVVESRLFMEIVEKRIVRLSRNLEGRRENKQEDRSWREK